MKEKQQMLIEMLRDFGQLSETDIAESLPLWKTRKIKKGDFFNMQNVVCNDLGLVLEGIFRIYYVEPDTDLEKNMFFFSENQFVVSFRSFITRYPCSYYIQAIEDSEIIYISYSDLQNLYERKSKWGNFGRLLAELFFNYSQARTEELLFNTHEQRYLKLLDEHPNIVNRIPAYHISSYLGITNPSLSRIRKRISK
jgi:CRP-like cAMP-binding protein